MVVFVLNVSIRLAVGINVDLNVVEAAVESVAVIPVPRLVRFSCATGGREEKEKGIKILSERKNEQDKPTNTGQ